MPHLRGTYVLKLYKASHIRGAIEKLVAHMGENVRLTMAEDVLKSFWLTALARKSIGIPDKLYVYCDSSSSITRKIDANTRDKKIADIGQVITELGKLSQVDCLRANASFSIAQRRAIAILTSVQVLEHRYDGLINGGWGGGGIYYGLPQISTLPSQVADLCALAWLYLFSRVCQALDSSLESTFSKKDSASGEQCGSVAKIVKGTTAKVANLPQFLQSYHSPTANLRILEEESQARCENSTPNLESTFSYNAFFLSSRDLQQHGVAIHDSAQAESTFLPFVLDSSVQVDCHADKSARNDNNIDSTTSATILNKPAQDSRILDEKCGLQGKSQGSYLSGNDRRDFSPLPHFSLKAESTSHLDKVAYVAA